MGPEQPLLSVPACTQTHLEVFATTTVYQFDVGTTGVQLEVNFTTPAFDLDDDDATYHDWPVTYVQFQVLALDGFAHHVQVYLDTSAESIVNDNSHEVEWGRTGINDLPASLAVDLFIGTTTQNFGSVRITTDGAFLLLRLWIIFILSCQCNCAICCVLEHFQRSSGLGTCTLGSGSTHK